MSGHHAIGGHQSANSGTTTWLTPEPIIWALGGAGSFDLDPCAAPEPRPWATARHMNALADGDGLALDWWGRVWLNPPYSTSEIGDWLAKLARHNRGTALIFARTETYAFERHVWGRASGLLFLYGRLNFHHPNGRRATRNAGAPSVLVAYGRDDLDRLAASQLGGALVPLRFSRFMLVAGLDLTWSDAMTRWLADQDGPISLADAYRHFARHPKAARNPNWQAKVRQKIREHARRVGPGEWEAAA